MSFVVLCVGGIGRSGHPILTATAPYAILAFSSVSEILSSVLLASWPYCPLSSLGLPCASCAAALPNSYSPCHWIPSVLCSLRD